MTTTRTRTQAVTPATEVASRLLTQLETAWNNGDGGAFGGLYTEDASFVTVRGEHIVGRPAIAGGHQGIFETIYAGSVNRMELVSADELVDGVVLAVSSHTLHVPRGPLAGTHSARSTSVLCRGDDETWSFAASHNTLEAG